MYIVYSWSICITSERPHYQINADNNDISVNEKPIQGDENQQFKSQKPHRSIVGSTMIERICF